MSPSAVGRDDPGPSVSSPSVNLESSQKKLEEAKSERSDADADADADADGTAELDPGPVQEVDRIEAKRRHDEDLKKHSYEPPKADKVQDE
jgi:hypothetical protein